jgi:TRAP-type C4-dicarboxylate transport system substrate-binding protein
MELAEIKHGRLAMIAFSAFGLQEYVSKVGVVDETPFFFFPITETLRNIFG